MLKVRLYFTSSIYVSCITCILDVDNEVSVFTMEVNFVRQNAGKLEEDVYANRHSKGVGSTALVPNTQTRVGLVDIPYDDMTAGVIMTRGCNATITFQVIGGKKERISVPGSQDSNDEEKLSTG